MIVDQWHDICFVWKLKIVVARMDLRKLKVTEVDVIGTSEIIEARTNLCEN